MRDVAYTAMMAGVAVVSTVLAFGVLRNKHVDAVMRRLKEDLHSPLFWSHVATVAALYGIVKATGAPKDVLHATDTAMIALLTAWLGHLDGWFACWFVVYFAVWFGVKN